MTIPSSEKAGTGKEFTPVPEGSHVARCVSVVDLGVQETPFGDKDQVYLGFEVYDHRVEWEKDGEKKEGPGLIGVTWTNNLYEEANLGKALIAWRGKPFTPEEKKLFDLGKLLGVPCMLSVVHNEAKNGKVYANVAAIMGCPKGLEVPAQETESIGYSPKDPSTKANLDKLPEWLQNKAVAGGTVMKTTKLPDEDPGYAGDDFDDDIPF